MSGSEDSAAQALAADRVLAIRQTDSFGDPGGAFVLELQNTEGYQDFTLSLKAQMLSVQTRSTVWTFDYRVGNSGSFTTLGTYSDPGVFGTTTFTFTPSQLSAWNDQSSPIWFRVVALTGTSGSGNRDTFGIDDFSLNYSPVPEPGEWGAYAAVGLLGFWGLRAWRQRCTAKAART